MFYVNDIKFRALAITVGWTGEGMDGGGYITSKIPEPDRRQGRHGMAFIWADSDADI